MFCWKCGTQLPEPPGGKLPFRATCDKCSAWLHCCKNCKNYKPGLPNDCAVPGTEFVPDREGCNFCEEFKLLGKAPSKGGDIGKASKKLFGDDAPPKKTDFGSLFKDET